MNWSLPNSVDVAGTTYAIRTDYRCILDILTDLASPEADGQERALIVLIGFFPDFSKMPPEHYQEALEKWTLFINCGSKEPQHKTPKLVDWEQDYPLIIAPINRIFGFDVRSVDYMHWWTWVSAYFEVGDCAWAQVVRIRDQLARGKTLDKSDREWYRRNRELVDFKNKYTSAQKDLLKEWGGV